MLAITCNLDPDTTKLHHPQGLDEALSEICRTVRKFGFELQQDSLYLCQNNVAN
jgi:virulence-associated protein VapD